MFSLHETTQRRVCRVAFLALCVVPTLWTLAWIAWFHRPWRQDDWRRALSQQFHVRAAVEDIQSPRPGVTTIAKLEIADLHSGRSLAAISELRIKSGRSRISQSARRVEIQAGEIPAFATSIGTSLDDARLPPLDFHAEELTIVGPRGELVELSNLCVLGEATGQLQFSAETLGTGQGGAPAVVRLTAQSQRDSETPQLHIAIDAQQAQLPAWLVADLIPGIGRCESATFTGSIQLDRNTSSNTGKLQGRFANVDLRQWLGPLTPYQLEGIGSVQLDQFEWQAGRIMSVAGQLRAGRGRVDRALLQGLAERMYCVTGEQPASDKAPNRMQVFDELGCGFKVTSAGIALAGLCRTPGGETGCLLTTGDRPLLTQPAQANVPLARLFQVVMPPPTGWLPLSREAVEMATGLPLPPAIPQVAREIKNDRDGTTTR